MIEDILKAQLEQSIRQSEALETIAACLQTIVKQNAERPIVTSELSLSPTSTLTAGTKPSRSRKPADPAPPVEKVDSVLTPPTGEGTTPSAGNDTPEPIAPSADDLGLEDDLADPVPEKAYSEDEVRAALRNYREINGSAAVMQILSDHGASGFGTLKPDQYASVMKAAR